MTSQRGSPPPAHAPAAWRTRPQGRSLPATLHRRPSDDSERPRELASTDAAAYGVSGSVCVAPSRPNGHGRPCGADVVRPCSTVSQWVNDILKLLFGAINKITSSLLPIFLANLVSIGLELAHGALGIVISVLTAPVVAAIKTGISLLALAFKAVSILRPWSLRLTSSPQPISYSNRPGSVRLSVADPGRSPGPRSCKMREGRHRQ